MKGLTKLFASIRTTVRWWYQVPNLTMPGTKLMLTRRWNGVKQTTNTHHTISDVMTAFRPAVFSPLAGFTYKKFSKADRSARER